MEVKYDNKSQLSRIEAYVIPGEILYAVYDLKGGGTGFVGMTDKRLIFYDQAFMRKKAMVTIPYSQVVSVASEDSGAMFATSALTVRTSSGDTYEMQFRTSDKAHSAYVIITSQILQAEVPG